VRCGTSGPSGTLSGAGEMERAHPKAAACSGGCEGGERAGVGAAGQLVGLLVAWIDIPVASLLPSCLPTAAAPTAQGAPNDGIIVHHGVHVLSREEWRAHHTPSTCLLVLEHLVGLAWLTGAFHSAQSLPCMTPVPPLLLMLSSTSAHGRHVQERLKSAPRGPARNAHQIRNAGSCDLSRQRGVQLLAEFDTLETDLLCR
jgi:hypothetical protein